MGPSKSSKNTKEKPFEGGKPQGHSLLGFSPITQQQPCSRCSWFPPLGVEPGLLTPARVSTLGSSVSSFKAATLPAVGQSDAVQLEDFDGENPGRVLENRKTTWTDEKTKNKKRTALLS